MISDQERRYNALLVEQQRHSTANQLGALGGIHGAGALAGLSMLGQHVRSLSVLEKMQIEVNEWLKDWDK